MMRRLTRRCPEDGKRRHSYLLGVVCACMLLGCNAKENTSPKQVVETAGQAKQEDLESWDVVYLQGSKAGYAHNKVSTTVEDGRPLNRVELVNRLKLSRFGQANDMEIQLTDVETPDGEVLSFETRMSMGPEPMISTGTREEDHFVITTRTAGRETTGELRAPDVGGFYGAEQSLMKEPLEPGQKRSLSILSPGLPNVVVATVELEAQDYEPTQLLDRTVDLLRIKSTTTLPDGAQMEAIAWTDRNGSTLKTRMDFAGLDMETYRTSREAALEEADVGKIDLGFDNVVRIKRRIPNAHDARRIRYRVRLKDGDPAAIFAHSPTQQVRSVGPHEAEVTVTPLSSDSTGKAAANGESIRKDTSTEADLSPNDLIQSDDPLVVQMAQQAVPDEQDPWKIAQALERLVNESITTKSFSTAFATAAEVAKSKEGDCTEHAVLLAALARARGIPARVAIGLVYVESMQGFGYHMWTEVYVDGRWVALDATLANGGIGPAHLKLAHSNLQGASAFSCFLPVASVLGQLEIEVIEIES